MSCEIDTPVQTSSEGRGLHVVGIPTEARIPPPTVDGVAPRVSQSTETGHVRVPNAGVSQSGRERLAIELRVVARSRNGADVDDAIDIVSGEQPDELVARSCRMPNRKDGEPCHILTLETSTASSSAQIFRSSISVAIRQASRTIHGCRSFFTPVRRPRISMTGVMQFVVQLAHERSWYPLAAYSRRGRLFPPPRLSMAPTR